MSKLTDILGGVKKDIGGVAADVLNVPHDTGGSPVAQDFTKNLQHNLGNIGNYFAGDNPGSPHFGGSFLAPLLGGGGGGGKSGPAPAPTDYWTQSIGGPNSPYSVMNGIDPNKLMQYFQQTQKGFNPNDQKQVEAALAAAQSAGWIQPSFLAGQSTGNDPLTQQAMFQNTIKPYLNQISGAENTALNKTEGIQNQIQQQYGGSESPDVKALLGNLNASVDQQGSEDLNYAKQAALTGPGVTEILDALRAQYINQLNNLTTGTGTTASAKLPAPSTLTAVNNALAG